MFTQSALIILRMAQKLYEVEFTESNSSGPVYRWNITPLPPAPLIVGQHVNVRYDKIDYDAKMREEWNPEEHVKVKKGKNAKLIVYLPGPKETVTVNRNTMSPKPPACLSQYSAVTVTWKRKKQKGILTEGWELEKVTFYSLYMSCLSYSYFLFLYQTWFFGKRLLNHLTKLLGTTMGRIKKMFQVDTAPAP